MGLSLQLFVVTALVQACLSVPPYLPHYYPSHPLPLPHHLVPNPHPHPQPNPHPLPHPNVYPHPLPHPVPYAHPVPHPHPVPNPHSVAFPSTFSIGVASAAYNIEGAWCQDGKVPSIWDEFTHNHPEAIVDRSNGDIADDSYNRLEEDIGILRNLSAKHYEFSISWSRIIPECGEVNEAGIEYYQRLLNLLKKYNIEPIVTLYHLDLPQYLQDQGGFLNSQFPLWFKEYATVVFERFGACVKYWITFSSPNIICNLGYGEGVFAPGISDNPGVNDYICGHNLLKAHADVYHLYDECYRPSQKGKISLAIDSQWYEPNTDCEPDREASERILQFTLGWWAHPIYNGNYPDAMISQIGRHSQLQGLCESRLPTFTPEEIAWIKDTHDFFSLNFLQSVKVKPGLGDGCLSISYDADVDVEFVALTGDLTFGIRKLLNWINNQYGCPQILISLDFFDENNCEDDNRITYIHDILCNVYAALVEDKVEVFGYTYYSFIDGFAWYRGYTLKWGLYAVDYESSFLTRTARKSAEYFSYVAASNCINYPGFPIRHYVPPEYCTL